MFLIILMQLDELGLCLWIVRDLTLFEGRRLQNIHLSNHSQGHSGSYCQCSFIVCPFMETMS